MNVAGERRIHKSREVRDRFEALQRTQRATLNILEDFDAEREKLRLLQLATMNVLEDFDREHNRSRLFQKAILNLLKDMDGEKKRLKDTQRASLNILEDFDAEKEKLRHLQHATMNVLEDFDREHNRSRLFQKALLNLLKDMDAEKRKLRDTQRALMNMLEDVEGERGKADRAKSLLALVNLQLVSAQESERRRVSYDLHDNVWQMLVAIRFEIERLFSGQEEWATLRKKSREVMASILAAVGKIRSMQGDLWPYVLDDIGTLATIDWYCREFKKNHSGLDIERKSDVTEEEIPSPSKIVIYRILQEALSNVAKHSQASYVTVVLMRKDSRFEFAVEDNGVGFDLGETLVERTPFAGLGISTIKARTELSGGVFGVESVKGKGTAVRASWPV